REEASMISRRLALLPLCACLLLLGNDGRRWPAGSPGDPCYTRTGQAQRCQPAAVNAALGRRARASSSCGRPHSAFCDTRKKTPPPHPLAHLTDAHHPEQPTCWESEGQGPGSGALALTLPLGRTYEISRVALRFCSARPESLALYKSGDGGRSWSPLRFYSARCREVYGRPEGRGRGREGRALCTGAQSGPRPAQGGLVSFRAPAGTARLDASPLLRDWATATHLRAVFSRPHPSPDGRRPSYAVSDFQVRGRCQCNGHAARCPAVRGIPRCDCRHNTEGRECQVCQPFYRDRPWARATARDAHECVACNCHRHSTRCRFNMQLYERSGRRSGGVCLKCRHNTDGRHCHLCRDGYTRDKKRPLTHRKACRPCQCHPVGALSSNCNPKSGQCQCKTGVLGMRCNSCAAEFQPSRLSPIPCTKYSVPPGHNPSGIQNFNNLLLCNSLEGGLNGLLLFLCNSLEGGLNGLLLFLRNSLEGGLNGLLLFLRIPERTTPAPVNSSSSNPGGECESHCVHSAGWLKMDLREFCRKQYAFQARIAASQKLDDWWRFNVTVRAVYKQPARPIGRGGRHLWVPDRDLGCGCPRLRTGGAFLLLGGPAASGGAGRPLVVDRGGLALPWREAWAGRLRKLRRAQRRGECQVRPTAEPPPSPRASTLSRGDGEGEQATRQHDSLKRPNNHEGDTVGSVGQTLGSQQQLYPLGPTNPTLA
ncbi:netrin-1-like, partial [Heterodontus francisci]|uniref:netrin-1-like n=1 Tax=Heterodontus francisci TaxID=7792 RepID=UPI00355BDF04